MWANHACQFSNLSTNLHASGVAKIFGPLGKHYQWSPPLPLAYMNDRHFSIEVYRTYKLPEIGPVSVPYDINDATDEPTNALKLIHQSLEFSKFNNITARRSLPVMIIVVLRLFVNMSDVLLAEIMGVMQTIWWSWLKLLRETTIELPKAPSCETLHASRGWGLVMGYTLPQQITWCPRTVVSSLSGVGAELMGFYGFVQSDNPPSYPPISNLNNISKLLERLFISRLYPHVRSSPNFDHLQSAYRPHHSTETALLQKDSIFKSADRSSLFWFWFWYYTMYNCTLDYFVVKLATGLCVYKWHSKMTDYK